MRQTQGRSRPSPTADRHLPRGPIGLRRSRDRRRLLAGDEQRQQQSAADAAAVGGAQVLIYKGCGDQADAQTAGRSDAANNGFTHGSGSVTVTISNPPSSGPYAGNTCAVQAQVFSPHGAFLSKLLVPNWQGEETTQATAAVVANNNWLHLPSKPQQPVSAQRYHGKCAGLCHPQQQQRAD